jgi:hypothetical protein
MIEHTQDSDCRVDPQTGLCRDCGALHGAPCYHCRARAFHKPGCLFVVAGKAKPLVKRLQRIDSESPADRCPKCGHSIGEHTPAACLNVHEGAQCGCSGHFRARRPNMKDVQFVAVDRSVMRGQEHIATAVSRTMAQRIARALNLHKPNSRGF